MKQYAWYIAIIGGILALIVLIELGQPRRIDWSPWFSRSVRAPYGTYLLHELLPSAAPERRIVPVALSTFQALQGMPWGESDYVVITNDYDADQSSVEELLSYVDRGSDAFIAAELFPPSLLDSLGVTIEYKHVSELARIPITFSNPTLGVAGSVKARGDMTDHVIEAVDTAHTEVLARTQAGAIVLARVKRSEESGYIYISTTPYLFTNFAIVDSQTTYFPFAALSYLGSRPAYWDDFYNPAHVQASSPLRYLLSQPSLAWAYYLTIVVAALFVFVYGRRRQRIIPVVKPLPNMTLDFVKTVGGLYFQHRDHRNLAEKKIQYFLDHLQTRYGLRGPRDDEFRERLAARSGRPIEQVNTLVATIDAIEKKLRISDAELLRLTSAIDSFYTNHTAS